WAAATGRELPRAFFDELCRFDADVDRAGLIDQPKGAVFGTRALWATFCNGAAGLVLLWVRAYDLTRDLRWLRRARAAAASLAHAAVDVGGHLCCGLGGHAYALLAMDRIEPGRRWYERALHTAVRALEQMVNNHGDYPNALFWGYPGIVCLALDLASP